jgi:hypothetical protein
MNHLTITYLFLSVFLFNGCGSSQLKNADPLLIKDAYYFPWTGGVEGATGTTVVILPENTESFTPGYLYFLGEKTPLEIKTAQGLTQWIAHLKDTEKPSINMNNKREEESNNIPPTDGINLHLKEGEAEIIYTFKGKQYRHKISNIRKEKRVFYP